MKKFASIAAALAATALLTAGAIAQTPPRDNMNKTMPPASQNQTPPASQTQTTPAPANQSGAVATQSPNQLRATQLLGLDVYNSNQENIGDINEVILSKDGRIEIIVVGAGGWLGMGQHNVGLPFEQVKFVYEPAKGNQGTKVSSERGSEPDHAMVNMTKDQLKAMPAFTFASDRPDQPNRSDRPNTGNTPPASKR